jgi:hypothetical protein
MANRPIYPDTIKNAALDIENADGTTKQLLLTAGSNGARIGSIGVVSNDTSAIVLNIFYNDGTTDFLLGSVSIPTLSGTDGSTPAVALLNSADLPFLNEDLSFFLEAGDSIKIAPHSAVTSAKKVTLIAQYGDY